MPSDEELAKAIAEMRKQGLSDDEIRDTLTDMGATPDVIARLLGGTTSAGTSPAVKATSPSESPTVEAERGGAPANADSEESDSDDLFAGMSAGGDSDVVSSLIGGDSQPPPQESAGEQDSVPAVRPVPVTPKPLAPPPVEELSGDNSPSQSSTPSTRDAVSVQITSDDIAEIKEMLRELKKELREQKALLSALQKVLQEILDTDRSLIVDLYEKAKKK